MVRSERPLRVSLVALPDGAVSSITGLFDVLNSFSLLSGADPAVPRHPPFKVEIVAASKGPVALASGLAIAAGDAVVALAPDMGDKYLETVYDPDWAASCIDGNEEGRRPVFDPVDIARSSLS